MNGLFLVPPKIVKRCETPGCTNARADKDVTGRCCECKFVALSVVFGAKKPPSPADIDWLEPWR